MERDGRARTLNAIFEATEARRSSDYFRELSVRDPLTGLHNRRHLDSRLAELLGRGRTTAARGLTVGLVDLDHFKRINDTRSHAVGDEVLRQVAGLLQAAADESEAASRHGWAARSSWCCCPASTGAGGSSGSRSCGRHRRPRVGDVTDGVAVTASIGVASAPEEPPTAARWSLGRPEPLPRQARRPRPGRGLTRPTPR